MRGKARRRMLFLDVMRPGDKQGAPPRTRQFQSQGRGRWYNKAARFARSRSGSASRHSGLASEWRDQRRGA